jgi:hypothetical protein
MIIATIKPGTTLVSNHQSGPVYCQVVEFVAGVELWQNDHLLAVKDGEFIKVPSVGDEGMKGIGWKVATEAEIAQMEFYRGEA